jgi:uncharacterized protein (DUF433 family)
VATTAVLHALDRGCYEAPRAAALSGVPQRTVYQWAKVGLVVPSVSHVREMLWSYGDLLTMRLVDWLRRPKTRDADGIDLARTAMPVIRSTLAGLGDDLWRSSAAGLVEPLIQVTPDGRVYAGEPPISGDGVEPFPELLDLFAPFSGYEGRQGPDLRRPRPRLRIVPGKVSGEPHLAGSRLTTVTVASLAEQGYELDEIVALYPREDPGGIADALALERELARGA